MTESNPATSITSEDTKTIRVNGVDKLNFISGRDYSNFSIKANFEDSTYKGLQVTSGNLEIPSDKNSAVSGLNVIDSRADITGTDEVDNVVVINCKLQSVDYSDIELNGGADTLTVQNTSVVSSNFAIDGGADNDVIEVQNVKYNLNDTYNRNENSIGGGYVDGTVKLSTLPETFTLNGKTYSYDAEKF